MSSPQFPRKPYTGSCHCGNIKYIIYLSLPTLPYPKTTPTEFQKAGGHRIYKCNCTVCHKMGLFHIRPHDAANDFFIVTPKRPFDEGNGLRAYVKEGGESPFHFCERCGVRCFSVRGKGYVDEVEISTALLQRLDSRTLNGTTGPITAKEGETTKTQVWRPSKDWRELKDEDGDDVEGSYLSVNMITLDAHNEGLDLRQLLEKGYLGYMQTLEYLGEGYFETPFRGGCY